MCVCGGGGWSFFFLFSFFVFVFLEVQIYSLILSFGGFFGKVAGFVYILNHAYVLGGFLLAKTKSPDFTLML